MSSLNTIASHAFRAVLALQLVGFWILSRSTYGNPELDAKENLTFEITSGILIVLLVLDLTTRKNPARRFAKIIDTLLGIGWILLIGALVLRSLIMGTI